MLQKKTYTCNVYKISDPIVIIIHRSTQQQAIFFILIILIQRPLLYNNIQIARSFSTPVNNKTQIYIDVSSTKVQKDILYILTSLGLECSFRFHVQ